MGKNKYIETPEKMWELFTEYRTHCKSNPRIENVLSQKLGEVIPVHRETPLTMEGFENYVSDKGIIQDLGDYFANTGGNYKDYSTICSRIKRFIRQDQIEGGMVNIYNASITQRLNSLTEKTENKIEGSINTKTDIDYSKLSKEALEEIAKLADESKPDES